MKLLSKKEEDKRNYEFQKLKCDLEFYKKNYESSKAREEVEKATEKYKHIIGQWFQNDECFFQVVRVGFKVKYSSDIRLFFECHAPNWEDIFDMDIWDIEKLKPMTKKQKENIFNN